MVSDSMFRIYLDKIKTYFKNTKTILKNFRFYSCYQ